MDRVERGVRDRVSGGGGPTRNALFCSPAYPNLEKFTKCRRWIVAPPRPRAITFTPRSTLGDWEEGNGEWEKKQNKKTGRMVPGAPWKSRVRA